MKAGERYNAVAIGAGTAGLVTPTFAELARKTADACEKTRLTPFAKKFFRWLYERDRRP